MILILLIAVFIYILCTADSTESCIPNEMRSAGLVHFHAINAKIERRN